MVMKLTTAEYNVVNKLAHQSKMDCWFLIKTNSCNHDYIYDLEEKQGMSLADGILMLNEGLTDLLDYDLTPEEVQTYRNLITKLEMEDR